jgi:hypothetical protein
MSRHRYVVTGVWRGMGAEITMALRSRHPDPDFDWLNWSPTRRRSCRLSKILPLPALTR